MCYFIPRSSTKLSNQSEVRKAGDVRKSDRRHGRDLYNAISQSALTVAINELLCMKNAGAQIAMDFS